MNVYIMRLFRLFLILTNFTINHCVFYSFLNGIENIWILRILLAWFKKDTINSNNTTSCIIAPHMRKL